MLCCVVLCCIVLYGMVWYGIVLYCIVLYCIVWNDMIVIRRCGVVRYDIARLGSIDMCVAY